MKKYLFKKNSPLIIVILAICIIASQLIFNTSHFKTSDDSTIICTMPSYYFWNIVSPSEITLNQLQNFENILPISFDEEKEYSSYILDKFSISLEDFKNKLIANLK